MGDQDQDDGFPFGSLQVDDESWDPPLTLFPGRSFFFVFYGDVDATHLGPLMVTSGSITWGNSDAAAFFSWPAMTPLFIRGSFSEVEFTTERLLEDFEAYSQQADTTGPDYLITTTGNPADPGVVTVGEGLAEGAGIELDASNQVAFAASAAGTTDGSGFLLIADIPAFSGSQAGPIAAFFEKPSGGGRSLSDATLRAAVRETTGNAPAQMRFLLGDDADNEITSSPVSVGATFETVEAGLHEFSGDPGFDYSQITGIGLEFLAETPGTVPALRFQVDDVELVPEPGALARGLAALAAVALLRAARVPRSRRSRREGL